MLTSLLDWQAEDMAAAMNSRILIVQAAGFIAWVLLSSWLTALQQAAWHHTRFLDFPSTVGIQPDNLFVVGKKA